MANALYTKLQTAAQALTCREWVLGEVLSPQDLMEKFEIEHAAQPSSTTEDRLGKAPGRWAVVFHHPPVNNARTGATGRAPLEAIVEFSPEQVQTMTEHEVRKSLIGVIVAVEIHELLEWAQLSTAPGVPIINPHHWSQDLQDVIDRVHDSVIAHAG